MLANNVGNIFEYKNPLGLLPGGFYPTNHTMKIGAFTHIMSSQCKNVGIKRFSLPFCNDGRDFNLGPVDLIWVDMISLQFLSLWKMRSSSWLSDWLDLLLLLCEQKKKKGIEWFFIADSKYSTLYNNVYRMNLVLSFSNAHYFQITKVIVVGISFVNDDVWQCFPYHTQPE